MDHNTHAPNERKPFQPGTYDLRVAVDPTLSGTSQTQGAVNFLAGWTWRGTPIPNGRPGIPVTFQAAVVDQAGQLTLSLPYTMVF